MRGCHSNYSQICLGESHSVKLKVQSSSAHWSALIALSINPLTLALITQFCQPEISLFLKPQESRLDSGRWIKTGWFTCTEPQFVLVLGVSAPLENQKNIQCSIFESLNKSRNRLGKKWPFEAALELICIRVIYHTCSTHTFLFIK